MALTHADLADAEALWEEWTAGKPYDLDVQVIGEHRPAGMDPDRPLGAILAAKLSLRVIVTCRAGVIFDQACPYEREALLASVRAISRVIGESG